MWETQWLANFPAEFLDAEIVRKEIGHARARETLPSRALSWARERGADVVGRLAEFFPLSIAAADRICSAVTVEAELVFTTMQRLDETGRWVEELLQLEEAAATGADLPETIGGAFNEFAARRANRARGQIVQAVGSEPSFAEDCFDHLLEILSLPVAAASAVRPVRRSFGGSLNSIAVEFVMRNGGSAQIANSEAACQNLAAEIVAATGQPFCAFSAARLIRNQRKAGRLR